jgi:hypothetical protein
MALPLSRALVPALVITAAMAMGLEPAAAGPWSGHRGQAFGSGSAVVRVSDDDSRGRHHRRVHPDDYDDYGDDDDDDGVVRAPFAYVDARYSGRVAVDAPFTSVLVGRRGVWVRAPFVDLYVPKR